MSQFHFGRGGMGQKRAQKRMNGTLVRMLVGIFKIF